ncbi:hypothetical protein [Streptococcus gordonii]|uniref:hypothetical protein n=1 Tax=Streptococcus gordonii TaxID=1302 RepID=UPI000F66B314|nr:hypothetical protein [Streptococcus gordonii]RSK12620.1 hypothetical protein D8806_03295 [Streptococcus gordonii]
MTDKIKVKGKKYMSESSELKELFATEYEAAVKKGYQEFMLKIEDSEADAVTAFLNLLNELQEMVYEVYPQTVKKYAKVLSNYVSSLESAGFNDDELIQSIKGDNDSVQAKLKKEQYDEAETVKKDLQAKLDAALDLLNEPKSDFKGFEDGLTTSLNSLASNRNQTHVALSGAQDTAIKALQELAGIFTRLRDAMANAKHIHVVSVDEIAGYMELKKLTAENMGDLEAIQDENDGKMLAAAYSKDPFNEMAKVPSKGVSVSMMTIVNRTLFGTMKGDLDQTTPENLNDIKAFVNTLLKNNSVEDVQSYMDKLMEAGDRFGISLTAVGVSKMPGFPKRKENESDASYQKRIDDFIATQEKMTPELRKIQKDVEKANALTNLYSAIYVRKMGHVPHKMPHGGTYEEKSSIDNLKMGNGNITFDEIKKSQTEWRTFPDKRETVTVGVFDTYGEGKGREMAAELDKIEEKRLKANLKFVSDVIKTGGYLGGPETVAVTQAIGAVLDTAANSDGPSNARDAAAGSTGLLPKKYQAPVRSGAGLVKAFATYHSALEQIDEDKENSEKEAFNTFNDVGGGSVSTGLEGNQKVISTRFSSAFDLQSALSYADYQENGLRNIVYQQALAETGNKEQALDSLKAFDKKMEGTNIYNSTVTNFIKGENVITPKPSELQNAFSQIQGEQIIPSKEYWNEYKDLILNDKANNKIDYRRGEDIRIQHNQLFDRLVGSGGQ